MTVTFRLADGTLVSLPPPPLASCGCPERAAGRECVVCRIFREMLENEDPKDAETKPE